MTLLGSETVTITPQTQGVVDGRFQLTPGTAYTAVGTVIPVGQKILDRLPEGARTSARWQLIIEGAPQLRAKAPADRVTCSQGECVVIAEIDFSGHTTGLPHRSYVLAEEGADE